MGVVDIHKDGGLFYRGRYNPTVVDAIREIPGREWNPKDLIWTFPANRESLAVVTKFRDITVKPRVWDLIRGQEETLARAQQAKMDEKPEPVAEMPIKDVEPFAHQIKAFNMSMSLPHLGLLHEQGCGKTLTTVAILGRRFLDGEIKRVLIVAPLSVLQVWKNEFESKADYEVEVKLLIESMVRRGERLQEFSSDGLHVAITNYEAIWRSPFYDALMNWKADMIIADESQRIKGISTNQSKGMHRLSKNTRYTLEWQNKNRAIEKIVNNGQPYRMILTGTPVTASPLDFWSQYKFLDPNVFGGSYYAFARRYAVYGGYEGREIIGYQHKDELVQKAHSIAHRVSKMDALDLPPETNQELYCELEPQAMKTYKDMLDNNVAEIESELQDRGRLVATNVLTRLLRLQQITGGFIPRSDTDGEIVKVSDAKLNLLKETLTDLLVAGHKVVIFARFIPEIYEIKRMLEQPFKDVGQVDFGCIYGAVPYEERNANVARFQSDPDCRVFLAQIQTAGLGITLHAADKSILYSLDFNYANYDQCKARLHRIGQEKNVTHIHLLAKNTVDNSVYGVLKQKKSMADDVVDNWRKYLSGIDAEST